MGPSSNIDPLYTQEEISQEEFQLRAEFAELFCHYHNAYTACIELGFAEPYARDWAEFFMRDSVTRKLIRQRQQYLSTEEGLKETKSVVISKLMELGDYVGPGMSHGARVTAWTNVAKLLGMEAEAKPVEEVSSGVMVVPELSSPDNWGQFALESQRVLKETVKE